MSDPGLIHRTARVHPTAIVEEGVRLGAGTSVWDGVHIRHGARVGERGIVGEKSYIAYDVVVGDLVKINAMVYVCAGVTVGDGVMIAAGTIFTNDRYPRALDRELVAPETSDLTEDTLATRVADGVTIGAGAVIGPGLTLGRFSMVGMGSVVTRDVLPHVLVIGNPARPVAVVCACGPRLASLDRFDALTPADTLSCPRCERTYGRDGDRLVIRRDPWADGARLRV